MASSVGLTVRPLHPTGPSRVTAEFYDKHVLSIASAHPPSAILTDVETSSTEILVPNCGRGAAYDTASGQVLVLSGKSGSTLDVFGKNGLIYTSEIEFDVGWILGALWEKELVVLISENGDVGVLVEKKLVRVQFEATGRVIGAWRGAASGTCWILTSKEKGMKTLLTRIKLPDKEAAKKAISSANKEKMDKKADLTYRGMSEAYEDDDEGGSGSPSKEESGLVPNRMLLKPVSVAESSFVLSRDPVVHICETEDAVGILSSKGVLSLSCAPYDSFYFQQRVANPGSALVSRKVSRGGLANLGNGYLLVCYGSSATIWDVKYGICHSQDINLGGPVYSVSSLPVEFQKNRSGGSFRICASIGERGIVLIDANQALKEVSLADAIQSSLQFPRNEQHIACSGDARLEGVCLEADSLIAGAAQAASVGEPFQSTAVRRSSIDKKCVGDILCSISFSNPLDAQKLLHEVMAEYIAISLYPEPVGAAVVARCLVGILQSNKAGDKEQVVAEWMKIISKAVKHGGISAVSVATALDHLWQRISATIGSNNIIDILTRDTGRAFVIKHVLEGISDLTAKDFARVAQYALRCNHNHLMECVISARVGRKELTKAIQSMPMRDVWSLLTWCTERLNVGERSRRWRKRTAEMEGDGTHKEKRKSRRKAKDTESETEAGIIVWVGAVTQAHFSSLVIDAGSVEKVRGGLRRLLRTVNRLRTIYQISADLLGMIMHVEERGELPQGATGKTGDIYYSVENIRVPFSLVQS